MTRPRISTAALLLALVAACARAPAAARVPSPAAPGARTLPPVPHVDGPIAIRIVYPAAGSLVSARDSNFIFGSVGSGGVRLTINGAEVPVADNGAFLAFLPLPAPDSSAYVVVATRGADTVTLTQPVRLLPARPMLASTGPLVVDSSSLTPRGALALRESEPVRVAVRAPANAGVWVSLEGGVRRYLVSDGARPGARLSGRDSALVVARDSVASRFLGEPTLWATDLPATAMRGTAALLVARGADTLRFALPRAQLPTADGPTLGVLGADTSVASDTDRVVIARPTPGGTYKWFLLPGTVTQLTGRRDGFARMRLDSLLEVWVADSEVRLLPPYSAAPRRVALDARVIPSAEWVDLVIPVGARPPYLVTEHGSTIVLTLYGTQSNTDIINYVANDSLMRTVEWEQETSDRVRYTLHLATRPYGYLAFWTGGAFVLRVRRQPAIDPAAPLRGLRIAVDPGHPPGGARGPTGLYEADAVLAVGRRVQQLLEARGATVVMTRTTYDPVPLYDRPIVARRANAHALVSIHLNAFPDGVNPFVNNGTGTFFFHAQAEPLARAIQRGMVARMGLRDLGVYYDNLALTRPTWMPAVLTEAAFLMIPEHEAALRTPEFQTAYAQGIVDGLEAFFRSLPQPR
jgi:N-acetylmuramoyl-L-alanine amidase